MSGASEDPAETLAALWRLSRDEAASLEERVRRLELAVMRAMQGQNPADGAESLLAEQRIALEETRLRTARILDLLDGR